MKELVVISGKGGTGKTSIVASFAALAKGKVVADCDVDAADLHLVLKGEVKKRWEFSGGRQAYIRQGDCIGCGKCAELCRFGAVLEEAGEGGRRGYRVDELGCEGCGVCVEFCPVGAIDFEEKVNGEIFVSETRHGPMVHAKLGVAEENSGKLVSRVREEARKIAEERGLGLVIIDGSPGIGCPVIASITGADMVLVVTEPTLSGLSDMERVGALCRHFRRRALVCINKWDINGDVTKRIEEAAESGGMEVMGRIGYDEAVTRAQVNGKSLVEESDGEAAREVRELWEVVRERLEDGHPKRKGEQN